MFFCFGEDASAICLKPRASLVASPRTDFVDLPTVVGRLHQSFPFLLVRGTPALHCFRHAHLCAWRICWLVNLRVTQDATRQSDIYFTNNSSISFFSCFCFNEDASANRIIVTQCGCSSPHIFPVSWPLKVLQLVEASPPTLLSKSVWTLMAFLYIILSAFRQAN